MLLRDGRVGGRGGYQGAMTRGNASARTSMPRVFPDAATNDCINLPQDSQCYTSTYHISITSADNSDRDRG